MPSAHRPRPSGCRGRGPRGPGSSRNEAKKTGAATAGHRSLSVLRPVRLRVLWLGAGNGRRVDKDRLGPLPLFDVDAHATLRLPRAVERHRALDGLVGTTVQRIDQLLVVDAVCLLGRLLDHLADTVGLGG